nr:LysM domain receptor-like kinase 3 [Tanacetum cinerariifolium]
DGLATTKSDVYAFGVLLFELISGKKALTRTETILMKNSEKRYLRDGLATTKSDVYAFGFLIFELISGKKALTRTETIMMKNSEKRSLASILFFEKLEDLANERINESNEMMDKVMTQMNDLYGLTEDECFNAMSVIARSALLIHIFDRLDEDGKVCMVQMVADGSVS